MRCRVNPCLIARITTEIPALWFAKEEMHMLGHNDVSDDREAMSAADLLQEFEK